MFTTGSKFLFAAATVAALGAILYGLIEGGALGTVGLTFAAVALLGLGGVVLWARDAYARHPRKATVGTLVTGTALANLFVRQDLGSETTRPVMALFVEHVVPAFAQT